MSMPPIRCFECGRVLGNKWEVFWNLTGMVIKDGKMTWDPSKRKMSDDNACDELGLLRVCCRDKMKTYIEY
jgi:DNA-directed RNA polymerase subunit N (RpoN/RPB10)